MPKRSKKRTRSSAEKNFAKEEVLLDFSRLKKFSAKLDWGVFFNEKFLTVLLVLVPLLLSVYLRTQPAYLPVTDDWARSSVYNGVRSNIAGEVNKLYPNLPSQNKKELVEQQFQRLLKERKNDVEAQVEPLSNAYKQRLQDDNGQTYLLAIDPYFYFRQLRNWVEKGKWYDELRNGEPWDNHMEAPIGHAVRLSFHVVAAYYLYKLVGLFNDLPLMTVFFYMPVLFSALAVIPAFFLAKRKAGLLGGFAAGVIVAVHPAFLGRTAGGFSDTDAYNVFFPLLIAWLFLEALEAEELRKKATLASLAGLAVGVFSFAWTGWWYIFDFLLVVAAGVVAYQLLNSWLVKKKVDFKSLKHPLVTGASFLVSSALFVTLFTSFTSFYSSITQPLRFRVIKNAAHANLWPNVYTTVAELGNTSLGTIVNSMGGRWIFFLATLGLVLTMIHKADK